MHRVFRAVGAAVLALTVAPTPSTPSATAAPLTIEATFSSTRVTGSCGRTTCSYSARSTVCVDVGVTGSTGAPYAGSCVATLSITVPRVEPVPPLFGLEWLLFCSGGSGTFTFTNDLGTTISSARVEVVGGAAGNGGSVLWAVPPAYEVSGFTVLDASGVLGAACVSGETPKQAFSGRLRYVAVI